VSRKHDKLTDYAVNFFSYGKIHARCSIWKRSLRTSVLRRPAHHEELPHNAFTFGSISVLFGHKYAQNPGLKRQLSIASRVNREHPADALGKSSRFKHLMPAPGNSIDCVRMPQIWRV
jgi:hypothetical protein